MGWACGGSPTTPSTLAGTWGGDHITLSVGDATHLELDCAHGDIAGPLTIDGRRQFSVTGTFVFEHGGPVRIDEPPDLHPARFSGSVTDNSMVLMISLTDSSQTIGTFSLRHGADGRVFKCL